MILNSIHVESLIRINTAATGASTYFVNMSENYIPYFILMGHRKRNSHNTSNKFNSMRKLPVYQFLKHIPGLSNRVGVTNLFSPYILHGMHCHLHLIKVLFSHIPESTWIH